MLKVGIRLKDSQRAIKCAKVRRVRVSVPLHCSACVAAELEPDSSLSTCNRPRGSLVTRSVHLEMHPKVRVTWHNIMLSESYRAQKYQGIILLTAALNDYKL